MPVEVAENSLKAFAALADGRYSDAASVWRHLPDIQSLPMAFRAVVLNNAAIARLILGDRKRSKSLLLRAADVSGLLHTDTSAERCDPRGTSSSFHFRLAAKYTPQFASAANARSAHIASTIAAIVGHHAGLADSGHAAKAGDGDQSLRSAFGRTSVEVSLLHARQGSEIAAAYSARLFRIRQSLAAPVTNERQRLELALAAMGILPPALMGAASRLTDAEMAQGLQ